ncbi:hypothetical protein SDRG_06551 [Saprolegnia diclina VS20]|uniref:Uncharacterized protein n=1 Tax=Saprolegnia diclina (strain VS20) TaxID=1156394 RepID=T0RZG5_SAPDV|nr:hypothetical protein SDRG_06551 [Saprolegnia diclina VS20]EQC35792.1 hypothetical protein SDRG_06551 [Saprolegnia diclina VS20]|eukprot:XP_008610554.1 hypothetical protein SDRG_06551 [Saprolegnia diclina VS20]
MEPSPSTMCSTDQGAVVGHFAIRSPTHEDSKLSDTLPLDDDDQDDDLPDFPDATSSSSSSSDETIIEDRLLKPMPVLAVCPMADAHTMLLDKPSMLGAVQINMPPLPLNMHSPPQNMILKRDPLAIRQQYWSQLGINLSVRDLERSTGRRRINREGIKVKLNDVHIKPKSKSFFKAFSRWVRNDSRDSDISEAAVEEAIATAESPMSSSSSDSEADATPPKESSIWMLQQGRLTPPRTSPLDAPTEKKQIKFNEEAVMYHIPLHRELSRRQRDAMWYTREEFISMVERNLDEMYDEMEREYEEQVKMEAAENDMMAAEEDYQRRVAVEIQKQTETLLQQQLRAAALLQQQAQLVKVAPRGSKEIRFKYLKHLGIHNN